LSGHKQEEAYVWDNLADAIICCIGCVEGPVTGLRLSHRRPRGLYGNAARGSPQICSCPCNC